MRKAKRDGGAVTRDDFARLLARKGYTQKDAGIIVDDIVSVMSELFINGTSVVLRGFGTFNVRYMAPRPFRTVHGKDVILPPTPRVVFQIGGPLKELMAANIDKATGGRFKEGGSAENNEA